MRSSHGMWQTSVWLLRDTWQAHYQPHVCAPPTGCPLSAPNRLYHRLQASFDCEGAKKFSPKVKVMAFLLFSVFCNTTSTSNRRQFPSNRRWIPFKCRHIVFCYWLPDGLGVFFFHFDSKASQSRSKVWAPYAQGGSRLQTVARPLPLRSSVSLAIRPSALYFVCLLFFAV